MSLPANFPASLDALANPTATTNRDDAGFELDLVVARIHDILEAIEAKVGIGASLPSAAGVLRRTAPGATAWGPIATADIGTGGQVAKRQLAYAAGSTLLNNTGAALATWGVIDTRTFTVDDAGSLIVLIPKGAMSAISYGTASALTLSLNVDGTGGGRALISGATMTNVSGQTANPFAGAGPVVFSGLSVGSHTVSLDIYANVALTGGLYLRCDTFAPTEHYSLIVLELKR